MKHEKKENNKLDLARFKKTFDGRINWRTKLCFFCINSANIFYVPKISFFLNTLAYLCMIVTCFPCNPQIRA